MNTLLFRNRRLLFLLLVLIVAIAGLAYGKIGRQEDPTITGIFATIVTAYPGADPARVEALVTEKIEEELREISEIDEIRSTSRTGVSVVSIELSMYIPDTRIEQVWSEVRDALNDASRRFPVGAQEPELESDRTGAYTAISAITMAKGLPQSPAIQRRYAELLQDRLRQIPDTKYVDLFGDREEEITISIDPAAIGALGLTFSDIAAAIARADVKVQSGALQNQRYDLLIEIAGEIEDLQRIRDVPVLSRSAGGSIRLGDLATVRRGFVDPPANLAFADGEPAVLVATRMEDDRQVDVWAAAMRAVLDEFETTLPGGIEHGLLFDQSRYTNDRFVTLSQNLLIGVSLVVIVLFLSLGWRAALVVTAMIPLASLLSFSIMQAVGLPVQQMSVTGLIVALGLLVDAAIVTSDEIKRRLSDGMSALAAVGESVRRLAMPLAASTVTTVLAFMPMALLPGPAGDFVGSIALSVIIMLCVSLLLALTVTPALAGTVLRPDRSAGRASFLTNGISLGPLSRWFDGLLRISLRHKLLSIVGALVLPLMGFAAFPTLTAQFFPGVERDQFYIQVKLPGGVSITQTEDLVREVGAYVRARDDIASLHWVVGESAPSFYYNMQMNRDGVPSFAEALVTSTAPERTKPAIVALQRELDGMFPQAQILVRGLVQGPPVDAPVELQVVGPNLDTLRSLGQLVRKAMADSPHITHVRADLIGADPKLLFELDEDKVRLAGLNLADVAAQMEAALRGTLGGSLVEATEELPVRVRLSEQDRNSVEAVRSVFIMPPGATTLADTGEFPGIPLSALGSFSVVPSDSPIARLDGERVNRVQGFVDPDVLPEEVLKLVQQRLEEAGFEVPAGYRIELGGDADARAETSRNLAGSAGMVVVLTILTIFVTFNSYRLSILTTLVGFLSMGLSLLALAVFQYPFGIQALIGAIGSIGVSVNAAIIILTALQADKDAMAGDPEAMRRVVRRSARHIVSTTITTVGGFVPLILEGGGFWPPFAMAIAGGVALSVVLAFFFTPPMFALMMQIGRKKKRVDPAVTNGLAGPALSAAQ